jgi:hypothetical protein
VCLRRHEGTKVPKADDDLFLEGRKLGVPETDETPPQLRAGIDRGLSGVELEFGETSIERGDRRKVRLRLHRVDEKESCQLGQDRVGILRKGGGRRPEKQLEARHQLDLLEAHTGRLLLPTHGGTLPVGIADPQDLSAVFEESLTVDIHRVLIGQLPDPDLLSQESGKAERHTQLPLMSIKMVQVRLMGKDGSQGFEIVECERLVKFLLDDDHLDEMVQKRLDCFTWYSRSTLFDDVSQGPGTVRQTPLGHSRRLLETATALVDDDGEQALKQVEPYTAFGVDCIDARRNGKDISQVGESLSAILDLVSEMLTKKLNASNLDTSGTVSPFRSQGC